MVLLLLLSGGVATLATIYVVTLVLVMILAMTGTSLGIRRAYIKFLLKIFAVSTLVSQN